MAYFALKCFSPEVGRYIIIGLNVIVAILGVTHWGFAGLYGQMLYYTTEYGGQQLQDALLQLYRSPIAYFSISGAVQVVVSILAILLLLQVIGTGNRLMWARILIILLVFQFAFDFFIAVYTSMMSSYFNSSLGQYIDYTWDYINQITDQKTRGMYRTYKSFAFYCTAEAIITWIVALPAVSIVVLGLTDQLLNENTVYNMGRLIDVPQPTQVNIKSIPSRS